MAQQNDFHDISTSIIKLSVSLDSLAEAHNKQAQAMTKIIDRHEAMHAEHLKNIAVNSREITKLSTTNRVLYAIFSFIGLSGLAALLKSHGG